MKKAKMILRIFFGIFLLVFGLNSFLNFIPLPEMAEQARIFIGAMAETVYMLPIIGALEVVAGVLLITNKLVPLTLIVIFPILLNAFLFHLFLDLAGIGGAFIAITLNIILFFMNKESYKNLFIMDTN